MALANRRPLEDFSWSRVVRCLEDGGWMERGEVVLAGFGLRKRGEGHIEWCCK